MSLKRIYLDHAATTPVHPDVHKAMEPYLSAQFGNPGSVHAEGLSGRNAIADARKELSGILHVRPDEVIFTSGATESCNLAIQGIVDHALRSGVKKPHVITTAFEHHAVLTTVEELEKRGDIEATYLKPDANGLVAPKVLREEIKGATVLIAIMYANNEIGVVQDIKHLARVAKLYRRENKSTYPYFFTDAVAAAPHMKIDCMSLGIDMLALSAHKFYGPKGVGLLFKGRDVALTPFFYGGQQEGSTRPGTENVPGIVGMRTALVRAQEIHEPEEKRLRALQVFFADELKSRFPECSTNGSLEANERIACNVSVSFPGIEGEVMVIELDARGIAVSTGSACDSDNLAGSHVILALGKTPEEALSTIRFTMGESTTKEDIECTLDAIADVVEKYRN